MRFSACGCTFLCVQRYLLLSLCIIIIILIILRQGLELTSWLTCQLRGASCFCLRWTEVTCVLPHTQLLGGCWGV